MLLDFLQPGVSGRWALGIIALISLVLFNETGPAGAFMSLCIALLYAVVSSHTRNDIKYMQIAYIRATNKCDFLLLYLGLWMDILALLASCAVLARTLSTCLDEMTEGMAKILILGRNAAGTEPWPDVIGVSVIIVITGMFMLGLENTKIFTLLMTTGIIGILGVFMVIPWMVPQHNFNVVMHFPSDRLQQVISGAAIFSYIFPSTISKHGSFKTFFGLLVALVVFCSNALLLISMSSLMKSDSLPEEYNATPIFHLIKEKGFSNLVPAVICCVILSATGVVLDLFPVIYNHIVMLSKPDWKILIKQIGYESHESGNPVLAIFTGGSLCAMLAFACPLLNLLHILAASHILSGLFLAINSLYTPYRPKFLLHNNDPSVNYTQLEKPNGNNDINIQKKWKLSDLKNCCHLKQKSMNILSRSMPKISRSATKEVIENEWLLLGESSVKTDENSEEAYVIPVESNTTTVKEVVPDNDNSSDNSTDIDAAVDEYLQNVNISQPEILSKPEKTPSTNSWILTQVSIVILFLGGVLLSVGMHHLNLLFLSAGFVVFVLINWLLIYIPHYRNEIQSPGSVICTLSILMQCLFLTTTFQNSWPITLFWLTGGLLLLVHWEAMCCVCLEQNLSNLEITKATTTKTSSIKGIIQPKYFRQRLHIQYSSDSESDGFFGVLVDDV